MLNFALPAALLLGLSVIPAALFYFLRMRFRKQPVGSAFLWLKLKKDSGASGKKLRWKSILLFLLQLIVLLALTASAALPQLLNRSERLPGVVYLLDASASMAARDGLAEDTADRPNSVTTKAKTVNAATASTTASEPSENISRFALGAKKIIADIKTLPPKTPVAVFLCDSRLQLLAAGEDRIESLLSATSAGDGSFQEKQVAEELRAWMAARGGDWSAVLVTDGGLDLGGHELVNMFSENIRTIDVGSNTENIGLGNLRFPADNSSGMTFTVANQGTEEKNITVTLARDGRALTESKLAAPAGYSQQRIPCDAQSASVSGIYRLSLKGNNDVQRIDDSTALAVNPVRKIRVLHVGPANAFLQSLLSWPTIAYRQEDQFPKTLAQDDWDLVIAEQTEIPDGVAVNLLCFGIIPPGSGIEWNGETQGTIKTAGTSHPLARYINWQNTQITEGYGMTLPATAVSLAEVNGEVVLAAREKNGQRTAVFGTDLFHSTIALSGAFPVFMRNMLQWCVPQAENPLADTLTVGKASARAEPSAWKASDGNSLAQERTGSIVRLTALRAGEYEWKNGNGAGKLAANIPLSELDITPRHLSGIRPKETDDAEKNGTSNADTLKKYSTTITPIKKIPILLALIFLVAEWLMWYGLPRSADKRIRPLLYLRIASLACLLLAILGSSIPLPSGKQNRVVLIDVSPSLGIEGTTREREIALSVLNGMKAGDRAAIVTFSGTASPLSILQNPSLAKETLKSANLTGAIKDDETDVSSAIKLANKILTGESGNSSIILITDGRTTTGGSLEDIAADSLPFPIHSIALGGQGGGVFSRGLDVPSSLRAGDTISLKWKLESDRAGEIEARIKLDGIVVNRQIIKLENNTFTAELNAGRAEDGAHSIELEAFDENGNSLPQLESTALLNVEGKPTILQVNGNSGPSPLAGALRVQGLEIREGSAAMLPEKSEGYADCSAVILNNVPAVELSDAQQTELRDYVASGGGLLVVGGNRSLGMGDYFSTKLEDMLPVRTDSRQRIFFTHSRILFLLDHSESMSDTVGSVTKVQAAIRGIAASLDHLNPMDEVGILSFDSSTTWLLPFTPVKEKQTILNSLTSVPNGGGTAIYRALDDMAEAFRASGPERRHVILLTDGQDSIGEGNFLDLSQRLEYLGVGVTAIGIGNDINETLLRELADRSSGEFYRAEADTLPALIDKETTRVSRDLIQEGNFAPRVVRSGGPIENLEASIPNISGYLVTKAKPMADVYLDVKSNPPAAVDGGTVEPTGFDPLLASWHFGNGTVAVFTSDSGTAWLKAWSGKQTYSVFWSQLVKSLERSGKSVGLKADVKVESSRARLTVEAIGKNRTLESGLQLVAGDGKQLVNLTETAPGRYEADIPLEGTGLVRFTVRDLGGSTTMPVWAWNPPNMEMAFTNADIPGLDNLSAKSGGVLLPSSAAIPPPAHSSLEWVSLVMFLLISAVCLFLVELGIRSTMLGQMRMALALLAEWWQSQLHRFDRRPEAENASTSTTDEDQKKTMSAYQYLARQSARRMEREEKDKEENKQD